MLHTHASSQAFKETERKKQSYLPETLCFPFVLPHLEK